MPKSANALMESAENFPQKETIQGVPVVLDLATVDDITIKNLQMTMVDAYEKSFDGKDEKEQFDKVSEAIYAVVEYLLPESNFEQFQFDLENIMGEIDEEKEGNDNDGNE